MEIRIDGVAALPLVFVATQRYWLADDTDNEVPVWPEMSDHVFPSVDDCHCRVDGSSPGATTTARVSDAPDWILLDSGICEKAGGHESCASTDTARAIKSPVGIATVGHL